MDIQEYVSLFEKFWFHRKMDSLKTLCIREVGKNVALFKDSDFLERLPPLIKTQIVVQVTRVRSGFHDDSIFCQLMHSQIRELNLSSSTVTDESLRILASKCPNLLWLEMYNNGKYNFTSEGFIAAIRRFSSLMHLKLSRTPQITDSVIDEIAKSCPRLDLLELTDCTEITDKCIESLKKTQLTKLGVAKTNITDKFVIDLTESKLNDNITELNFNFCNITHIGLRNLRWDKLETIDFQGCPIKNYDFLNYCKSGQIKSMNFSIEF